MNQLQTRTPRLLTVKQLKSYLYLKTIGIEMSETARTNQRKFSDCLTFVENIIKERYEFLVQNEQYKSTEQQTSTNGEPT